MEHECIVVGAGPAGLTAAMYLGRYLRDVLVVHDGRSRALKIPKTHNAPGFPDGVHGTDLIARMTRHAEASGAEVRQSGIAQARHDGRFHLTTDGGDTLIARALILATGVCLNDLPIDEGDHDAAVNAGILRYCPICDGFEHRGMRIGVIGHDTSGAGEALFVRRYSDDVTLMPLNYAELAPGERARLDAAGIRVIDAPSRRVIAAPDAMLVDLPGGERLRFDVLYPALGCHPRSELAAQLGLPREDTGVIDHDAPRATEVPGLFVAGDVVEGLDQISVAIGQGAVAATRAHNWLRGEDGERL